MSSTEQAESWPAIDGVRPEHRRGNGFATAALALGVAGVTLVTVVPGVVFGILGRTRGAADGAGPAVGSRGPHHGEVRSGALPGPVGGRGWVGRSGRTGAWLGNRTGRRLG